MLAATLDIDPTGSGVCAKAMSAWGAVKSNTPITETTETLTAEITLGFIERIFIAITPPWTATWPVARPFSSFR